MNDDKIKNIFENKYCSCKITSDENRAAADGQTAIVGAWGGASASRNPLVPQKGDGGILRICITDALLANIRLAPYSLKIGL